MKTASGNAVVCTWSEGVRHGAKKNGYHGGVSAQEVVVPLSIFTPAQHGTEGLAGGGGITARLVGAAGGAIAGRRC